MGFERCSFYNLISIFHGSLFKTCRLKNISNSVQRFKKLKAFHDVTQAVFLSNHSL